MESREEQVKTVTGEEKTVKIGILSFQKRNDIMRANIEFGISGKDLDVKKIDYFNLMTDVLKATLQGVSVEQLADGEGDKIYNKYFSSMLESIGGESSKNSQQTSEQQ